MNKVIIKNLKNGKYIAEDYASGMWSYEVSDIWQATRFSDVERALQFCEENKMDKNKFAIVKLEITENIIDIFKYRVENLEEKMKEINEQQEKLEKQKRKLLEEFNT